MTSALQMLGLGPRAVPTFSDCGHPGVSPACAGTNAGSQANVVHDHPRTGLGLKAE